MKDFNLDEIVDIIMDKVIDVNDICPKNKDCEFILHNKTCEECWREHLRVRLFGEFL